MFLKHYKSNFKGLFFIVCYKISNYFTKNIILKIIGLPIRFSYKLIFGWILGIDVPDTTSIGNNFVIWHGIGLVINPNTIIGNNVIMRHNTTIGNAYKGGGAPTIKDGCNIGANCVIIGEIVIGENAIIGAGSVVTKDIPANAVAYGNPCKVVKIKNL